MTKETWKPVPGYEGFYEVSDQGRVRSLDREIKQVCFGGGVHSRTMPGRILKLYRMAQYGYLGIGLCKNGKTTSYMVHSLVAKVFLGPRPENQVVRHLDGDCLNNVLSNLCYGTHSENQRDVFYHGRRQFNAETINEIRGLFAQGLSTSRIAKLLDIPTHTIAGIRHGRVYKHV